MLKEVQKARGIIKKEGNHAHLLTSMHSHANMSAFAITDADVTIDEADYYNLNQEQEIDLQDV